MTIEYHIIEKFDKDNSHLKKEKIWFILIDKGLWKVVCGKYTKPTGSSVGPVESRKWKDAYKRALSSLCLHLTDMEFLTTSKVGKRQEHMKCSGKNVQGGKYFESFIPDS